ncbi:hypothetical protein ACT6NV_09230 [Robiginitalea sp. IMCC44478]|uniref:hypothetical protein n=1 Tax=Robiginitalea sp. IMCC44478 TaxID=3459122 RepID=UPI0040414E84
MNLKKLYKELVRRNVFRALVAYLAVAWVLIQIATTLLPIFNAPAYLLQGFIFLLAIGLIFWIGFSWVYDLTPKGIQKTPETYDTSETRQLNTRRLNTVIVGSVVSALLILMAGSFWAGSKWRNDKVLAGKSEFRIAVLPFEDRSDNAEYEYLREALAEDVISTLFSFSRVSVISSRSAFQFRDSEKSIGQISKELNADIVLIGNYAITNQKVDVKVEVIDTKEDEILNYASIVGDLGHIAEISSQIGVHLKESIGIVADQSERNAKKKKQSANPEAFKLYALGKSAMRDHTGQKLGDIVKYFQAAIELDPEYVDPYIGMAEAYIFDVNRGYLSATEGALKAKEYALKAAKLDPGSGEVSGILGIVHSLNFEFKKAIPYFKKSLEESPNFDKTYHWYSFALEILGDFSRAEELQKKAGILDPLNVFNDIYLALNYIFQRDLDRAEKVIEEKLRLSPDHKELLWIKAVLLVEKKEYDKAYQTLLRRNFGLETNFIAGYVYTKVGQEDKALEVLNHMLETSERKYVSPSQIAIVLCALKRYDEALEKIEEAYLIHDQWILWVKSTSLVNPIKEYPEYVSLMDRLVQ